MPALRAGSWRSFTQSAVLICGALCAAAAQAQAPPHADAAKWLDRSAELGQQIVADDPLDSAYDRADLFYQLAIAEAAAGRKDRALLRVGQLRAAVTMIVLQEGDQYEMYFLPGPLTVAGLEADAKITAAMLRDDGARLDAANVLSEAFAAVGDQAGYAEQADVMFELLPKVQQQAIDDAAADPEWDFDGTHTGWYIMRVFRDAGDLARARRFAGFDWQDPCEAGGTQAILAQLERAQGDKARAESALERAKTLFANAAGQARRRGDAYYPDLDNHLPELVAAIWVIEGRDAALAMGEKLAHDETIWRRAAMVHAATILRRMGQPDQAKAAVDMAWAQPLPEPDSYATWDGMHLCRELVRQGRLDDAEAYAKRLQGPASQAFANLGIAQGVLDADDNRDPE